MKCPYCAHDDSRVIDSRSVNDGVRRRRQCVGCGARFTTYERVESNSFLVVKKDGRREEFSREKLATGIRKACAKRPVSNQDLEGLVDRVEEELHQLGRIEVPVSTIGALVMDHLRELDRIAYIRFASVYREFADVESFKDEVEALARGSGRVPAAQLPLIPTEQLVVPARGRAKGSEQRRGREDV
ncbi:MAG: transcriptional repressor NrdR [Chloroflexi bacterium]|nr:MAG: transcriptional repressor NrdR [Chloroflexota bacterium]